MSFARVLAVSIETRNRIALPCMHRRNHFRPETGAIIGQFASCSLKQKDKKVIDGRAQKHNQLSATAAASSSGAILPPSHAG
jgi:hypothetical protein